MTLSYGTQVQYANHYSIRNDAIVIAVNGNIVTLMPWIGPSSRFHTKAINVQLKALDKTQPWISRVIGKPKGQFATKFEEIMGR